MTCLQGSQDMAHWHDWWNKLSGFQRQLILLMSTVDDFWSSLTDGQRTVTGDLQRKKNWHVCSLNYHVIKFIICEQCFQVSLQ